MVKLVILINSLTTYFMLINQLYCQTCQNEFNQQLDWFVIYKIPNENLFKDEKLGFNYVYMTNKDHFHGWRVSSYLINDSSSLVGSTLNPIYISSPTQTQNLNFFLYSDKPPKKHEEEHSGHSKGVIVFNSKTGFWLIHSVPNFPPVASSRKYTYPQTGKMNGQSLLCVSFDVNSQLSNIIKQLLYIKPMIYDIRINAQIKKIYPELDQLIEKKWYTKGYNRVEIISLNGNKFESFSKSPAEKIDLYADFVALQINSGLLVETWRKGEGGSLSSNCSLQYMIENVKTVSIKVFDNYNAIWNYTEDHSKWAIGSNNQHPVTCIGDINRMKSQNKRGGGTVCFHNVHVWKTFLNSIKDIEQCLKTYKFFEPILTKAVNWFLKKLSLINFYKNYH